MNVFSRMRRWIVVHKAASGALLIAVALTTYGVVHHIDSAKGAETRYVLGTVEQGTVVASISGSGQVAASNQIDIQPKVSGEITSIAVKAGQSVKQGDVLLSIDSRDAANALETAKLSLAKLEEIDPQTKLQDQNTLQESQTSLTQSYVDAATTVAKTMLDLPTVASGLDTLYISSGYLSYTKTSSLSEATKASVDTANQSRYAAEASLNALTKTYTSLSQSTNTDDVEALLKDAQATTLTFVQAVSDAQNAVELVAIVDDQKNTTQLTTARSSVSNWTTTVTGDMSNIISDQSTIAKAKNSIQEETGTLADLTDGPDPLDIRSAQLAVQQKQEAYDDYFVRAPFDGVVASFTGQVGQDASGSVGTLITQNKIATITLNEVDVAKVAVGQKVTLTFDAIDGLSISGEVAEVDAVGTVSQGVVNYTIKIGFDTQDERVKPGMSVSAAIITDSKADVLVVPNSAVKTGTNGSYVLVLDNPAAQETGVQGVTSATPPRQIPVEVGIASSTETEITSGLTEGQQIVTKTVTTGATTSTTAAAPSLLGGATRAGAGAAAGARRTGFGG